MTFDQFSAFNYTFCSTYSSCLFLCIFISADVVILFLYMKSFEEFKICRIFLDFTFKSKDILRFLELIPFLKASCSTHWQAVGLSFRGLPVDFLIPYASGSCKMFFITFLDFYISQAITWFWNGIVKFILKFVRWTIIISSTLCISIFVCSYLSIYLSIYKKRNI